ncbi:aldehyde dehydrogenase family protein [Paracoccus hibiscisoli]|uniref:aldehyde dehydrogenase family protein n=1 Tax=Paracoccus hibiscisoli TaxID=2023261 RepID=UPI0023F84DD6|nr:aldehyde dehydrogenase family protein [Paracoccus hibiscisoli]
MTPSSTACRPDDQPAALDKIKAHVADALAQWATIAAQATVPAGRYACPTALTGATTAMMLASEETFGPIFRLMPMDQARAKAVQVFRALVLPETRTISATAIRIRSRADS